MMRTKYLLFIFILALSACKELEDPISTSSDAVFYLKGTLNNNAIEFTGGDSANYHYTAHQKDDKNVYEFISEFKSLACVNCDDKLKITIRSHEKSLNNTVNIFDALGQSNYEFLDNVILPKHRIFRFFADTAGMPIGSNISFFWDFGDGTTSTEIAPFHYFKQDGKKVISLEYTSPSCTSKVIKDLPVQVDTFPLACYSDFKYIINGQSVSFFPRDTFWSTAILWDFGDGFTSTSPDPTHTYATPGKYNVSFYIQRNKLACEYTVYRQVDLLQTDCDVEFTFRPELKIPPTDTLNLSKVLIEYTAKNGEYYRSDWVAQDNAPFVISDLEPYELNEKSEKTVRFQLSYTCELQTEQGKRIKFNTMNGKVGVSYP